MRIAYFVILIVHGLIHVLGFFKAFDLPGSKALPFIVARPAGIVWLLCTLLFFSAAFLFISKNGLWWVPVIPAIVLSQTLIITNWTDAKAGTIANIIIALAAIVGWAEARFAKETETEMARIISIGKKNSDDQVNQEKVADLPAPVRKWLEKSGALDDAHESCVILSQHVRIKMNPEQENWYTASALQVFTMYPPAFFWTVRVQINPLIDVSGMDKLEDGRGTMRMLLCSLIPVVNERENQRIDLGTMQRYLGEIVWFPYAALHPNISWKGVDEETAIASFTLENNSVEGTFKFGKDGLLSSFSTLRYMGGSADATERPWRIDVLENREMDGLKIPVKLKATWTLDDGDWTWLELRITDREER